MKLNKIFLLFIVMGIVLASCKKDDGTPEVEEVPPRLLSEVAAEDDAEIQAYLKSHFYNYEEFDNPSAGFDYKIKLDTISGDNTGKKALFEQMKAMSIKVSASDFLIDSDEEDIEHKYYYLVAREGFGEQATVADSAFVRYRGSLLNGESFDGIDNGGIWFDLPSFQFPGSGNTRAFRGVGDGISNFKTGSGFTENNDGTYVVEDYGVGMLIFPSGLGTFNGFRSTIPQYSPLIFTIDMLAMNAADHDHDGITSILEDINKDSELYSDDTDEDSLPNYLDTDDDGDGILTIEEISDANGNIIIPYPDTDGDGIPDYLDAE